jgi:hypothetical protein
MERIETLKSRIAHAEPYREWKCNDHNVYGTGGTNSYWCCQEELAELEKHGTKHGTK